MENYIRSIEDNMSYKYTIQINVTITTESEASALLQNISNALKTCGTNVLVQQTNCLQWVDQQQNKPQEFNEDGTVKTTTSTSTKASE